MKRLLFIFLLLINLIFIQAQTIDIKGYILNEKEQPIFDFIEVTINAQSIITGDSKYVFENMPAGEYSIKVNSPESKNHNPLFSSYENKFTLTFENGKMEFWNYSPKIILTKGQTFNFKALVKDKTGNVLPEMNIKLYSFQKQRFIDSFSNIESGSFRIIINDPFSPLYQKEYDFTEDDNKRNMIELIVGTYNDNIIVQNFTVWKDHRILYNTDNKNIGNIIALNFPGSPFIYNLDFEKISPWVVKSWPINNQTMFSIRDKIKVTFSEEIIFDQSLKSKILLYNTDNKEYLDISLTYDMQSRTIIATPKELLKKVSQYILIVSNISDINNNLMPSDYKIIFYTEADDFEDFNHKYLVKNIQNIELDKYIPQTEGSSTTEILSAVNSTTSSVFDRQNIVVKEPDMEFSVPKENEYYSNDIIPDYKVTDIDDFKLSFFLDSREIPVNFKISEEGRHNLVATLYDKEQNELKKQKISFTIDKTKPEIILSKEYPEVIYATSFKENIQIKDINLKEASILLNGREHKNEIELTAVGNYNLKISAVDNSNNKNELEIDIIIDNQKPMIITKPLIEDGKYYQIPFTLKVDVVDSNIDTVKIFKNGLETENNINVENPGQYTFKIYAKDKSGNENLIEKRIEAFPVAAFNSRIKFDGLKGYFEKFRSDLENIASKYGELSKERIIYSILTKDSRHATGIAEYNAILKEYNDIKLESQSPQQNTVTKTMILIDEYWVYPKIGVFLTEHFERLKKNIAEYDYIRDKFSEIKDIVSSAKGNVYSLYEGEKERNIDFFNMYYQKYVDSLNNFRVLVKNSQERQKEYESMLNNLYFANKIININNKIDNNAITHPSMKEITKELLMSTLRDRSKGSFAKIKSMLKDTNSKKYLEIIENEFKKRLAVNDLRFIKNEFKIISFEFLMIEFAFIVNNKDFNMEIWFEKAGDSYKVDHITNLISISYELTKLPIPVQTPTEELQESSSSSWIVILILILLIIIISGAAAYYFIKKKKLKKQAIEETFKKEEDLEEDVFNDKNKEFSEDILPEDNTQQKGIDKTLEISEKTDTENKVKTSEKLKDIIADLKDKISKIISNIKEKISKKTKKSKKEKIVEEKIYTENDIYPEDLDKFRSENKEDFELLNTILNKETILNTEENEKPVVLTTVEEVEIPVLSDDALENIVDELESSVKSGASLEEELTDNTDQFSEALDELSIQTPTELIEAEKKELQDEKIAQELGVNDLIGEEDIDEYLNLEIISGDEETLEIQEESDKSENKEKSENDNTQITEEDNDDLLALDELLNLGDDDDDKK